MDGVDDLEKIKEKRKKDASKGTLAKLMKRKKSIQSDLTTTDLTTTYTFTTTYFSLLTDFFTTVGTQINVFLKA